METSRAKRKNVVEPERPFTHKKKSVYKGDGHFAQQSVKLKPDHNGKDLNDVFVSASKERSLHELQHRTTKQPKKNLLESMLSILKGYIQKARFKAKFKLRGMLSRG